MRLALSSALLLVFPISLAVAQSSQPDQKDLEAQAKQLVAEGKALEKQGKLAEARDKYIDAEGVAPNGDALSGIGRIDDEQKQQVESLLAEAHRLYDDGKFSQSIEQLQHGLELQPGNAALHYDLALGYLKLDDRGNAALHLDLAIGMLPDENERLELLEQRSTVLMGVTAPEPAGEAKKNLTTFNESYLQEDRDPGDTKVAGGSLCDQTTALTGASPANPAVAFNSAKCAEENAHPEEGAQRLADYARLAPKALDLTEEQLQERSLLSLASLTGEPGQVVRQHYATASRYLDYRRYDRAIAEYEVAAQAAPDYPETQWQLALLYEAYGDTAKAREHFTLFQQLESDPARKNEAGVHLSNIEGRRAVYDANVIEAREIMTGLLLPSLGIKAEGSKHKTKLSYRQWRWASARYKEATRATEKLPEPFVQRELSRAREDLNAATELFPLGPEANEVLALIDLQGNDWPGAFRNYDAVASQSFPVSFYAQVNSARDSKVVRATKVEIGTDAVRLVYLSTL
jgi:tetratricopeptide (TPR) repeat protein